jgi:hypothetical protein
MSVGEGPHGSPFNRNAIENLPHRMAVPGITVHGAVIVLKYALRFRHNFS